MITLQRALLRLFPAPFRDQFGDEMLAQIEQDAAAARARGVAASLAFTAASSWDLVASSVAERFNPTWADLRPSSRGNDMGSSWQQWGTDLRQAVRALRRNPGFAAVTIGTLALAIGVNAGMFTVVKTVLLDALPYAHQDRLMYVAASAPGSGFPDEFGVSPEFYLQYREKSKYIEDLAMYDSFTSTLRVDDRTERVRMSSATFTLFSTLGVRPILGRLPADEDRDQVAVISYRLWQTWFNGDSAVIGKSYSMSGGPKRIIGVMGPSFHFPNDETLLWISGSVHPEGLQTGQFGSALVARVKPGTKPQDLANELTAISKTLPERFGGTAAYTHVIAQHRAIVRTLRDAMLSGVSTGLWVLLGAVMVVLLIACANVANLFMVRADARHRDLAVRRAIGASRMQLVQSQLSEAVIVAAAAGVLAMIFAWSALPAFVRAAPGAMPRIGEVHLGVGTLGFTLFAAVLAALACGLIPAIRGSSPDLTRLRDGGRGSTRQASFTRDGLVIGQTALALVLLIGSGLLLRSFWALRHVNPGYTTDNIFTFQIAPSRPSLNDGASFARFDLDFMDRLRALPGVETVGLVDNIPLDEGTSVAHFRSEAMGAEADGSVLNYTISAGDYYKAMNIHVLRGRTFTTDDHLTNQRYVVISKSAANLMWPGKDPIGQRIQRTDLKTWDTVIGVVDDVMQNDFRHKPDPLVYFPLVGPEPRSWAGSSPAFVVKTRRAEVIGPEIRALVKQVAPEAPMYRVFTMSSLVRRSTLALSFTMLTLGIVSTLALILTAVGLYGVLSYVVAQRTREIGVRMALGAEAGVVRRMVVAQGTRVVAIGAVIGVGVAMAFTRSLASLLYDVKPVDVTTFTAMSASMLVIGLLASYLPARRASLVDPTESLRGD